MGWLRKEPRDMVGQNPTGGVRKSSSRKRRQAIRRVERDLQGTEWQGDESVESEEEES